MRYTFPVDYAGAPCYVAALNRTMVPIVAGQMAIMEQPGSWQNADDYHAGYNAVLAYERCLMALCMDDLIASNDRLYRMLDTAIYGVGYTVESVDPLIVTPAIPPQRTLGIYSDDSILGRMEDLKQLLQNALNGTETPHYDTVPGIRALLQSIIDALGAEDTDLSDILAQLEIVAGLLA